MGCFLNDSALSQLFSVSNTLQPSKPCTPYYSETCLKRTTIGPSFESALDRNIKLRRLQKNFNVIILGSNFTKKDKTPDELKSNLVSEYKCSKDKSIQYIGFTSRPLIKRV